jgi:hypothetical protein
MPTGTGTIRCTLRETYTNSQRTNQKIRHSENGRIVACEKTLDTDEEFSQNFHFRFLNKYHLILKVFSFVFD